MIHNTLNRSSTLSHLARAFVLFLLPLLGTLQAQQGRPMVAANFVSESGFHTYDVTVMAIETANGNVHGFLRLVNVFDNGVEPPSVRIREAAVEELVVLGDTAYIRAGSTFLALEEGGLGAAAPGGFTPLFFLGTPPPLAFVLPALGFLPRNTLTQGNIAVQD